jgi:hypothetical protein
LSGGWSNQEKRDDHRSVVRYGLQGKIVLPFDAIETGKRKTFKAYRWEETLSRAKRFLREFQEGKFSGGPHGQSGVFVTDTPDAWGLGSKVLLEMRVTVKSPFKIPDKEFLEQYHGADLRKLRNKGYDAVVSTPLFFTERQAILLYPEQQVKSLDIKRSYAKPRKAPMSKKKRMSVESLYEELNQVCGEIISGASKPWPSG